MVKHSTLSASATEMWRLQRDGHEARCLLAVVPVGMETRVLFDGHFLYSYQFGRLHEALAWAETRRALMAGEGWTCVERFPAARFVWPVSA